MPDYTVKWPLEFNSQNSGYTTINETNLKEVAIFNLKNIILTVPGERIMEPNFGVGIKQFLFEQNSLTELSDIENRIINQVSIWAPYINILNIDMTIEENYMGLIIKFSVPSADISDTLNLDINL